MNSRTISRGLVDLPFDPLLVLLVLAEGLAQWRAGIVGDRITEVGAHRTVVHAGMVVQARERLILGILVAVVAWLLPALVRRSRRRWRGRPTEKNLGGLLNSPWHRDPLLWVVVGFYAFQLNSLPLRVQTSGGSTFSDGRPSVTNSVVRQSWAESVLIMVIFVLPCFILLLLGVGLRGLYRWLGKSPATPR